MHILKNTKGISLPMIIGLVLLLMVISVSANEMIIRTLRSVHRIEASDRAYFAAEAGIEDALYELTPHFAGYETPDIPMGTIDPLDPTSSDPARKTDFGSSLTWENRWTIQSHDKDDSEIVNGRIYSDQKLILSLFNDDSGGISAIPTDSINVPTPLVEIKKINLTGGFTLTIKVPDKVRLSNINDPTSVISAFAGGLFIDNDGDLTTSTISPGLNEDGDTDFGYEDDKFCPSYLPPTVKTEDDDCDGREDEDSQEDPVIYWKVTDGQGNNLFPKAGCTDDTINPGSEICEKNFSELDGHSITFDGSELGINEVTGLDQSISTFISSVCVANSNCQLELLIVAPLEQVDMSDPTRKIDIPYLEYSLETPGVPYVPTPFFTLESDGWFRDFKQSITTTVYPKTDVPLFDFTIIQQQ